MSFEIVTDSSCNLTSELIVRHGLHIVPLAYIVDGVEHLSYSKDEACELKHYYELLRKKKPISTSCINLDACEKVFEPLLKKGKDIYYIGFSSALSVSYNVVEKYLDEQRKKYPDVKIFCTDSLTGCMGEGRLVVSAAEKKEQGLSIEEVYEWTEQNKLKLISLFTVETLSYLYKGGRMKKPAYLIASTLNIKPILRVNDDGAMEPVGKVFGRKASLSAIANKVAESIVEPENQTLYIAHGDCIEDVDFLISKLEEKIKFKGLEVNYSDLVVGAHSGPGTIAVFFYGERR